MAKKLTKNPVKKKSPVVKKVVKPTIQEPPKLDTWKKKLAAFKELGDTEKNPFIQYVWAMENVLNLSKDEIDTILKSDTEKKVSKTKEKIVKTVTKTIKKTKNK